MTAGEMLEDFGAGYVDHLADFSSQPASNIIPLCLTSCKHTERDEHGELKLAETEILLDDLIMRPKLGIFISYSIG